MKIASRITKALALGFIFIFSLSSFAATDSGETVTLRGSVDDDYYAAAGTIDMDAEVAGDATLMGGELYIGRMIQQDLIAAGGSIRIRGNIEDDVRTAGGDIDIEAGIGDDLVASGGKIRISSRTSVGGDAYLAGGDVRIAGSIKKNLFVVAGNVSLSGTIHGDVEIKGGDIVILDSARIDGDLTYSSPEQARIHPDAKIGGQLSYTETEWEDSPRGFGILFSITLIIASIVLYMLFPRFTLSSVSRISSEPLLSLGMGLALLIFTPLVVIVLVGIVLGVWVGLSLLSLYFVTLLMGFLVSLFFVGERGAGLLNKELSTTGRRILSVVVAIVLLGVATMIPFVGGLLLFALLLLGTGAAVLQLNMDYKQSGKA